jgi:hypothetical protein
MYCSETNNWFKAKEIPFPEDYSLEKNRESLQTIFTFSDLKTYGGANIDAICQRLTKAKEAFSIYNVEANRFYPEILSRQQFPFYHTLFFFGCAYRDFTLHKAYSMQNIRTTQIFNLIF